MRARLPLPFATAAPARPRSCARRWRGSRNMIASSTRSPPSPRSARSPRPRRSTPSARAAVGSGALAGVPFAVKNLFDIAGLPTLAGSKINRDCAPAARDATVIARLEAHGAVLVGALNMGEYAYDFTGENVHYGAS